MACMRMDRPGRRWPCSCSWPCWGQLQLHACKCMLQQACMPAWRTGVQRLERAAWAIASICAHAWAPSSATVTVRAGKVHPGIIIPPEDREDMGGDVAVKAFSIQYMEIKKNQQRHYHETKASMGDMGQHVIKCIAEFKVGGRWFLVYERCEMDLKELLLKVRMLQVFVVQEACWNMCKARRAAKGVYTPLRGEGCRALPWTGVRARTWGLLSGLVCVKRSPVTLPLPLQVQAGTEGLIYYQKRALLKDIVTGIKDVHDKGYVHRLAP